MKKILILMGMVVIVLRLSAQTEQEKIKLRSKSDVSKLRSLSAQIQEETKKNKALAYYHAKIKGWPIIKSNKMGGFAQLQGITKDLEPIYYETLNYGAGIITCANKLYTGGGLGLEIHGESMTVGMWDAAGVSDHELLEQRFTQVDNASNYCDNYWPVYVPCRHATHVAGTLIGSDQILGPPAYYYQPAFYRGMAFKGNLDAYDWIDDLSEISSAASELLISNHSYTQGHTADYNAHARTVDSIMRLAPYYLTVTACGNGNPHPIEYPYAHNTPKTLSNFGTNKNGITVAATRQADRNSRETPDNFLIDWYSSLGPTDDGRIKPDLAAKGEVVFSSISPPADSYGHASGTSMAAPGVAGTLLLLQQYWDELRGNEGDFMRAATLKALAIHTADDAGARGPDVWFGWGVMNAEKAVQLIGKDDAPYGILENTLNNSGSYTLTVTALGSQPLIATICWTDLAGTVTYDNDASSKLVNNLDLNITSGGNTYYPWRFDPSDPKDDALRDDENDLDNVEKVEIDEPVPGQSYTIHVTHKGTLASAQNYSLIISGIAEECPLWRTITGSYAAALTHSATWIKAIGQTTITATASVILDADDQDGYVEIKPGASDYFVSAPSSGQFIAEALDGCGIDVPNRSTRTKAKRPVKYYNKKLGNSYTLNYSNSELGIFPNPGQGEFTVSSVEDLSKATIKVYDIFGKVQKITTNQIGKSSSRIKIETTSKGVYMIQVITEKGTKTGKVVVL